MEQRILTAYISDGTDNLTLETLLLLVRTKGACMNSQKNSGAIANDFFICDSCHDEVRKICPKAEELEELNAGVATSQTIFDIKAQPNEAIYKKAIEVLISVYGKEGVVEHLI